MDTHQVALRETILAVNRLDSMGFGSLAVIPVEVIPYIKNAMGHTHIDALIQMLRNNGKTDVAKGFSKYAKEFKDFHQLWLGQSAGIYGGWGDSASWSAPQGKWCAELLNGFLEFLDGRPKFTHKFSRILRCRNVEETPVRQQLVDLYKAIYRVAPEQPLE